jgi:phenylacetate-coenzyme A ligase PaaK-like adenylate-forming protein
MRRVFETHFDPKWGSRFWLDRAADKGLNPLRDIRHLDELALLGELGQSDLVGRPLQDFIPRRLHADLPTMIIAQTGGTTGRSAWTAYSQQEFYEAFVDPFVAAAEYLGFHKGRRWLYAGPSGPHIISRASEHLAHAMSSPAPFMVDLDPRWAKKLEPGSFALRRYIGHVVEQSLAIIREQGATVLFTTPPLADAIGAALSPGERGQIQAIHYGGMRLDAETLNHLQNDMFPGALHLSGYGNTLMGCCMELSTASRRTPEYFPFGERLHFALLAEVSGTTRGRVCMSRFDETYLLVNLVERDCATWAEAPLDAPTGFAARGLRDPAPAPQVKAHLAQGLY